MASKQDQRYIQIAKACLKALNQAASNPSDREKSIQAVYDAIDTAFNKQSAVLQRELQTATKALEQIKNNTINLQDAHRIATDTLENLTVVTTEKNLH
jgi:hypothetical protein